MAAEFADLSLGGPPRVRWPVGLVETLWMAVQMPGLVRRVRPDAIFIAGNSYTVVAVLLKLALGRRCPPLVAKMSNDLDRSDLWRPARWCYHLWLRCQGRCFDRAVAIAPALRDQTERRLGLASDRIAVIADPALDTVRVAGPVAVGEPRRFLFVGRLAPQKQLPLMLRAFAEGRRSGDRLTLIGEGPEAAALRRLVAELGIGHTVEFAGFKPIDEALLRRFHILLLSSRYEGLPAALAEALAAGLAVVSTESSPAVAALVRDLGTLVPVGDRRGLARAIAGDLQPPPAAAVSAHLRRFHIAHAAAAYQRLFAEVAARRASTAAPAGRRRPLPHAPGLEPL